MHERFTSIVVPVDLDNPSHRSIDVARCLATLADVPIELLTVLPDDFEPRAGGRALEKQAQAHGLKHWLPVVLTGIDVARIVADHVAGLDTPLVVMASAAHNYFGEVMSGSISSELLALVPAPVLVVGPHVDEHWRATAPTLLACVGPSSHADPAIPVVARWMHSFGGNPPWFLEVVAPQAVVSGGGDVSESGLVHHRADQLRQLGVHSEWEVLHGDDPVDAIESFAERTVEPVLLVESQRWTDRSRTHLHSFSRRLAHRSHQPVLVLPSVAPARSRQAVSSSDQRPLNAPL